MRCGREEEQGGRLHSQRLLWVVLVWVWAGFEFVFLCFTPWNFCSSFCSLSFLNMVSQSVKGGGRCDRRKVVDGHGGHGGGCE